MAEPMRLPSRPPTAAPARPAATRSPVPPPNCEPISPPATAPISVPVFSRGPVPVSGLPLHAAVAIATSAAALRRTKDISEAPHPPGDQNRPAIPRIAPMPAGKLMAQIRAKLLLASNVNRLAWQTAPRGGFDPQKLFGALAN